MDLIYLSNDTHHDYKRRVSHRVRRQLQAVGENLTEQEVDEILEKNDAEQVNFRDTCIYWKCFPTKIVIFYPKLQ